MTNKPEVLVLDSEEGELAFAVIYDDEHKALGNLHILHVREAAKSRPPADAEPESRGASPPASRRYVCVKDPHHTEDG